MGGRGGVLSQYLPRHLLWDCSPLAVLSLGNVSGPPQRSWKQQSSGSATSIAQDGQAHRCHSRIKRSSHTQPSDNLEAGRRGELTHTERS